MQEFALTTGVIFSLVTGMHIFRLINNWKVQIGPYKVPYWASVVGVIVGGYMAYWSYTLM